MLASALRALVPVVQALADEAAAREQQSQADPLLTDREVAEVLRVHVSDVSHFRASGALHSIYLSKRRPRTRRSALEQFLSMRAKVRRIA